MFLSDKLLCGQRPLAASPRTDPASGAERHTVTNRCDKLLFSDVLNSDITVGDGFPVPVILEQNHIAAGDKMLFPFGKSKNALHFWRDGEPVPYDNIGV